MGAAGAWTGELAGLFGRRLPVRPGKGYSATFPLLRPEAAPWVSLLDDEVKCAMSRLGDRLRVGGMAEIAGFNHDLHPKRRATLQHSVEDLFGGAGDQFTDTNAVNASRSS